MAESDNPGVPIPPPPPVPPPGSGLPKQEAPKQQPGQQAPEQQPESAQHGHQPPPDEVRPPGWSYDTSQMPSKPASMNTVVGVMVIFTFICMIVVLGASKGLIKGGGLGASNAPAIASQMVELHDPLPPDWYYGQSTDIMGIKVADVDYKPAGQMKATIEFITVPNPHKLSAQEMSNDANFSNNGMVTEGKAFTKLSNFESSLAGHKVHWAHGSRNIKGKSAVDVGFVELPNNRVLIIACTEYGADTFDQSTANGMLYAISKFKE